MTTDSVRPVREVEQDALRVAEVLRGRGVAAGDRVVLKADNSFGYVTALLALVHLDTSIVLVDHRQTPEETLRFAGLARARWAVLQPALPTDDAGVGPAGALYIDELLAEAANAPEQHGSLSFVDWFSRSDALIAWSSGTTGEPKGIVRSGKSFLGNIERTQQRMKYTEADVLMPLLPFSHQYGLSLVLLWWVAKCSFVVAPYTRLDHAVDMAGRYGVSVVDAAPATYHTLLNLVQRRPESSAGLRNVRMWCVGGAPLDRALADKFIAATGQPLLDGYGSTEVGNIALAVPGNAVGCGKPLDGVELQVINESGQSAAPGEIGEILVRSGGLMQGYLAADGSVVPREDDTYRTNDIGYRDADGNLYVVGRKFAVHRMGHTLYPEALARKAEAAGAPIKVVALDDERRGSQLVFVVADPEGHDARHWRELICAELPAYEQPNQVLVVAEFPLNANGKPDPKKLEQLVIEALPTARNRVAQTTAAEPAVDLSAIHYPERVAAIQSVLDFLRTERQQVVDVLTEISNHKAVIEEIEATIGALEGAVEEIQTYRPGQVDKMAVFMSSNVLMYSYALYMLIPSLYTDEIIFRPSGQVADTTRRLHELLAPVHKLESIELTTLSQRQFVDVPVAEANVLVFTGAYQNAEQVRSYLRDDQMLLFFGQGVNPFIVAPGADVDLAVTDAMRIRMLNSGQDCFGPDVFMVNSADAQRFTDLLVKRVADLRYGSYTDTEADYSSLCYETALEAAADYLRINREHIVQGGRVDFRSRHVEPSVLVRRYNKKMPIEETFSPIFNVVVYENSQQLKSFINSPIVNERAMAAMIYGEDKAATDLLSKRHAICANMTIFEVENGNKPFGGHGVAANYIAYQGQRHAEPILISKAVAEHLPSAQQSRMATA
ncbi:acyl-coenzyme A synthetase/AMP-(fatty) acid ligase/acyl-CoA reductase-like NAD-dependent aldehyde dehydrogenase [Crossiella equi]|uniref:Acyl-coenzyme A synthetase/AMP-(Fatty) acid ligase/acyl-CoA reductase-like NAD-dependent aldehyde dehydrogenase n=1 Tax=Crossiella equi TaxID=130796 RepID=A0ABS5ADF5_9PSEU|nr:aldehyde dehydrogenase family protein [Crossiella equi]MBP2474302.1 acyl-coenzyme A synthetase/AMP-(fatty) acid ligase/acyl-CoA reductase-like NAD-dependent aldehyde dehydrogenase [Crossiella equi]